MKRSKTNNFYLFVINSVKTYGKLPDTQILGITKQALQYYVKRLVIDGIIKKVGYATWKLTRKRIDSNLYVARRRSKNKSTHVGTHQPPALKNNRGHAFVFKLDISKLKNWKRREEYLKKNNISYDNLNIIGGGQKVYFKGKKIWLTNKSILIYDKQDYLGENAGQSRSYAIINMFEIVDKLGKLFNTSFLVNGRYRFKVTRQHHAKMNDILAKQYRKNGQKLQIRNDKGVWLICDYSFNIDELEAIHPKTSHEDMDNVVLANFNYWKDKPNWSEYVDKRLLAVENVLLNSQPTMEAEKPTKDISQKKIPEYIG